MVFFFMRIFAKCVFLCKPYLIIPCRLSALVRLLSNMAGTLSLVSTLLHDQKQAVMKVVVPFFDFLLLVLFQLLAVSEEDQAKERLDRHLVQLVAAVAFPSLRQDPQLHQRPGQQKMMPVDKIRR